MRALRPLLTLAVAVSLTAACASGGGSRGPTRNSHVLTAADLEPLGGVTLWEAIRELRPQWLRPRPPNSFNDPEAANPKVILDRQPFGEMNDLRRIMATTVARVEFLSARDATTQYGTGYPAGVFDVRSKRGGDADRP
ncbi:MAG: hypothetical protein D6701_02995 [Gemmatimonadetes bacterium]|nr:MAG: hypothetical protein D6701_02995 [Gemmatimonadota bacterium]